MEIHITLLWVTKVCSLADEYQTFRRKILPPSAGHKSAKLGKWMVIRMGGGGGGRNGSRRIELANQKQECGKLYTYIYRPTNENCQT
jgi:hypothetical protein